MDKFVYKIIIGVLVLLCLTIAGVNSVYTKKSDKYILSQSNKPVNTKPKSQYSLYDALNAINKYESLKIEKISLEQNNQCSMEVKYYGDLTNVSGILQDISHIEEVSNIQSIVLSKKDNIASFNIKFILCK